MSQLFPAPSAGGVIQEARIKLTPAQILALDAFGGPNNIQLFPAPGANKIYTPIHTTFYYKAGSVPYNFGNEVDVVQADQGVTLGGMFWVLRNFAPGLLMNALLDKYASVTTGSNAENGTLTDIATAINKPIVICNDSGVPFLNGNGTLIVIARFSVSDLS